MFRLQKVLEHRAREVEAAKRTVGRAMEALQDVERRNDVLLTNAARAAGSCRVGVAARLDLQAHLETIDAERRALEIQRRECETDLTRAQDTLRARNSELGAIEALEEKARHEWKYEEARQEQIALDEWATMRRPAVAA